MTKVRTKARVHEDEGEGESESESESESAGHHPASTVATSKRKALRANDVCGSGPANLCLNVLQLINNWLRAGQLHIGHVELHAGVRPALAGYRVESEGVDCRRGMWGNARSR